MAELCTKVIGAHSAVRTAVCLIVRDEDDYIAEWLAHYSNIGFDAAIIYDNGSSDETAAMISQYSALLPCRYVYWTPETHDPQLDAYNDCIARFGDEFDWIAFFDIDELLIPRTESATIGELVGRFPDASAIGINWLMFGSNGLEEKGSLCMMEAFTRRADLEFGANRNTKAIMRPRTICAPCNNPHWFPVSGPTVNLDNRPLLWCSAQEGVTEPDQIVQGDWRLHHYYTRGKKKWRARLLRGQFGGLIVHDENFVPMDRNDHEDLSAMPFARKVWEALARVGPNAEATSLLSTPKVFDFQSQKDNIMTIGDVGAYEEPLVKPHTGLVYTSFMSKLIQLRDVRTYLEIGVENGHCLSQMQVDHAIGIDPSFKLVMDPTVGKKKLELHRTSSDSFFRAQSCHLNIDFSFLDGLHVFEFLLRDIYNVEQHCASGAAIALHDALPLDEYMVSRKNTGGAWTGDIWKVVPILERYRPDMSIVLVDCAPTGLVLLTNLDPSSTVLKDAYLEIVGEYKDVPNNKDSLRKFYSGRDILSADSILENFNHTLHLCI